MDKGEFLFHRKNGPLVESYLRRSLEAILDIGRHILAKTYGLKGIEYRVIAKELGERGVVTKELSSILQEMVGCGNRMVHVCIRVRRKFLDFQYKNLGSCLLCHPMAN